MKKMIAWILVTMLLVGAAFGCAGKTADAKSDSEAVKAKGKLVVGITDFEPMDYQNEKGEWIGFDADLSKAFAESLGVAVEFTVIDWDSKTMELDAGNIDCVWNGMTLTDGVKAAMETSKPYCGNAQVIVVSADKAANFDKASASFAVESGSAGQEVAEENGWKTVAVQSQGDALLEVASGTSDACVIDRLMAKAMTGEGTSYPNLVMTESLNEEEYGVGFRKGSDLAALLDAFLDQKAADGTLQKLAEQYGVDVLAR